MWASRSCRVRRAGEASRDSEDGEGAGEAPGDSGCANGVKTRLQRAGATRYCGNVASVEMEVPAETADDLLVGCDCEREEHASLFGGKRVRDYKQKKSVWWGNKNDATE